MKKLCIICDLDGVYMDSRDWEKYAPEDKTDKEGWTAFGNHVSVCKPNPEVIEALVGFNKLVKLIFITSRNGNKNLEKATRHQIQYFSHNKLQELGRSNFLLYMRKEGDLREAWEVKEEILRTKVLPQYTPILAIDDEDGNIKMYEKYNIPTLLYTKFRK